MSASIAARIFAFSSVSTLVLYWTMWRAAPMERPWYGCVDVADSCAQWKATGDCTAPERKAFMKQNCKSTCGFCSHFHSMCVDSDSRCAAWAAAGECVNNADYMMNACARSCGGCAKCVQVNAPTVQTSLRRRKEYVNQRPVFVSGKYRLASDANGVWELRRGGEGGDVLLRSGMPSHAPIDGATDGQWAYFKLVDSAVPHPIDGHGEATGDVAADSHGNMGQFVKERRITVEEIDCDASVEEAARIEKLMQLPQQVLDAYHNPPKLEEGVHYRASYDIRNPLPPSPAYKYGKKPAFLYPEDRDPDTVPQIHYEIVSHMPKIYYFPRFLSDEEAEAIKTSAVPLMTRSGVIPTDGLKSEGFDDARTSYGCWLNNQHPHVEAVRRRVLHFSGFRKNETEAMQVLRYTKGAKYLAHLDYFDPYEVGGVGNEEAAKQQWDAKWPHSWNRAATFFLYLSDVEEGGETVFPRANGGALPTSANGGNIYANCSVGFRAIPKRGAAVLFYDLKPDTSGDPLSLHGGCPVVKGVKWSAPNWLHSHVREAGSYDDMW